MTWGPAWRPLGDGARRAVRPAGAGTAELIAALRAWPGVRDVVVTDGHVAVYFDPEAPPRDPTPALLVEERPEPMRTHTVRVRYDGADLDEIAAATDLSRDEVIARHQAAVYEVSFLGFLPGFAYLTGLDERLIMPRRASPRARVPAGSVAIAGPYTGIYPFASPGGWLLVGAAVDHRAWTGERATLAAGDQVRFVGA